MCINSLASRNRLTYRRYKTNHFKNKERGTEGQTGGRPEGMTTKMKHFARFNMVFVD